MANQTIEIENVAYVLLVIFSVLAGLCSIFTLVLIYKMKKWNNYILLITCLTVAQAIYDFSTMVVPCMSCNSFAIIFFRCYAGLVTTLWTNAIMLLVYYIVKTQKTLPINLHFPYWFAGINIYGFVVGIIIAESFERDPTSLIFFTSSNLYYWTRIASIIINIIIYGYLQFIMNTRKVGSAQVARGALADQKDPVRALVNRMKYYPIVQIICRGAATWFECQYGFSTYNFIEQATLSYRAADIIYVITLPSAGIGFFFVFVINSPGTLQYLTAGFHYYTCDYFDKKKALVSKAPLLLETFDATGTQFKMRDTMTSGNNFRELDPENMDEDQISDLIAYYNEADQIAMSSIHSSQNSSFISSTNDGKHPTNGENRNIATSGATLTSAEHTNNTATEFKPSLISLTSDVAIFVNISDDTSVNSFDMNPFRNTDTSNS